MKKIFITESSKNRIFFEAASKEKERGEKARDFRAKLKKALKDDSFEYDPQTNKIKVDGYSYEIGKTYCETEDGDPIPLHCTQKSIDKYLNGDT